jgi:acetyl esterase/lipase
MFRIGYPYRTAACVTGNRPLMARRLSKAVFLVPACLSMAMGSPGAVGAELKRSTFVYKTVGDVEIHADVHRPDRSDKRPVIAWFHGGALMMGSRQGVPRQLQELSQREGYVLVSFDYRLAPEVKIPQIIDDVRDGLDWVRRSGPELFGADPDRLVVAGASAGGYLTMMSGIAVDPPPTALVAYWGFGDVDGKWTTEPNEHYRKRMPLVSEDDAWAAVGKEVVTHTDKTNGRARGNFFIYLKQNGLWAKVASGFDPNTEPEKLAPLCPIKNLSPEYPPILMLHGTADKDVPCEQSVEMARALERLGRPHELITIENGGHSLWGGDSKLIEQAFARSMEYIREQLSTP